MLKKIEMSIRRVLCFGLLLAVSVFSARKMENLDRGLVAVHTGGSNVFLSWRMQGTEDPALGFNVYRDGIKLNASAITGANHYTDAGGGISASYVVKTVVNGVETATSASVSPFSTGLTKRIPLSVPAAGTTPKGDSYTYSPNDGSAGDLNGDGKWDLVLKWDPSNSQDNAFAGYTGNVYLDGMDLDGTRMWRIDLGINIRAGAHYTQFVVADFDMDGKAEIIYKTAPGTKDGSGAYLSKGPAAGDNDASDYRSTNGYILNGPEYLTVFRGSDGKELATVNYVPGRETVSSWGDSYGNRVDRFLAAAAWLDGVKPSAVMQRGYYTRMAVTAWDWNGISLTQRWAYDAKTKGQQCYSQGNHNLAIGDVDSDGKDEIIQGSCAINDDGSFMYRTGLGHGDAMHLGDLNPSRSGLEVWVVHEDGAVDYSQEMHDARTGTIIWGTDDPGDTTDNGRGLAGDVDASSPGYEMWSNAIPGHYSDSGRQITLSRPSSNFRIYWDGDLQDELLDAIGKTPSPMKIDSWKNGRLVSSDTRYGSYIGHTNNSTKSNPVLVADLLGDWREEMILRQSDNSALLLYTTTIPTTHRLYTLMHDPVYRASISWQNTAYNQPPHLGFFLGNGVANAPRPAIELVVGVPSSSNALSSSSLAMASSSSVAAVPNCGAEPCSITLQGEDFCGADGVEESSNAGFAAAGYLNFTNAIGSAAGYVFQLDDDQSSTMYIRYANGGGVSRNLNLGMGAIFVAGNLEFASTGSWTTWVTKEVPVQLPAGRDSLVFSSVGADGGPNIDWIGFAGTGIHDGSCLQTTRIGNPAPLSNPAVKGHFVGDEVMLSWVPQGAYTVRLRSLTGVATHVFHAEGSTSVTFPGLPCGLYSVELLQGYRHLGTFLVIHP